MKTFREWFRRLLVISWLGALPAPAANVTATFTAATDVPVSAASYTAAGNTVTFTLNFAPPVGTALTVVNNTGSDAIRGTFDNLGQWQAVELTYDGVVFRFVANYTAAHQVL